jgi:tricorn protease-like protein
MDANGTEEKRLTTNEAYDSKPAFSPSGTKIVFMSDRDGDYDLYVMDADGTDVRQLTNRARTIPPTGSRPNRVSQHPCSGRGKSGAFGPAFPLALYSPNLVELDFSH